MGNSDSKVEAPPVDDTGSTQDPEKIVVDENDLNFKYVVTTIDVVEKDNIDDEPNFGPGAKYVEFDGKIEANKNDTDAVYLLNVKVKSRTDDKVIFQGISVTQETFRSKLVADGEKILACIHGFQVEPDNWLGDCATIQNNPGFEHRVIPIVWPSVGVAGIDISIKYDREQTIAYQAGKALAPIAEIGQETHLSLMCHSMGNRVLFSYVQNNATYSKRFQNVFMVSADVWEEVFNDRVIRDTWFQPPWNYWNLWKDTGLKLSDMVKDGGKIHIASYSGDLALISSEYLENWRRRRLGRFGKAGQGRRIHKDIVGKLEAFDANEFIEEVKEADSIFKHSYQSMPSIVRYYNSAMNA